VVNYSSDLHNKQVGSIICLLVLSVLETSLNYRNLIADFDVLINGIS